MAKKQMYKWIIEHFIANVIAMLKSFIVAIPLGIISAVLTMLIISKYESKTEGIVGTKKRNAVIFLPLGILLPMIWKKMNSLKWILLTGFLGSLFIETSQFVLQCGVVQTEDLIMNTAGAGIGYWIYKRWNVKERK